MPVTLKDLRASALDRGRQCAEFAYESTCDPSRPFAVVTARSGVKYERCTCGIVTEVRPEAAAQ
jgi:hypothetical protein